MSEEIKTQEETFLDKLRLALDGDYYNKNDEDYNVMLAVKEYANQLAEAERLNNEKLESVDEETQDESGNYYQPLFNHMNDAHGLIILQTEMDEIINIVNKLKNEKLTADLQASTECVDHIKETCDAYQKQNEKLIGVLVRLRRQLSLLTIDKELFGIVNEALKETEVK